MDKIGFVLLVLGLVTARAGAAEYFVAPGGDDGARGSSRAEAFATVQRGVDALAPGDTLTIAPGEYHEAVSRAGLGGGGAATVIRAEIPGTVLIRGDVPAPPFMPVEGYRHVYATGFRSPVQAVSEADTFVCLRPWPDIRQLEFNPGGWYQDAASGKLYISTTDLQAPSAHRYTVSVLEGRAGLFLHRPDNVTVDGLAFAGFQQAGLLPTLPGVLSDAAISTNGIFLALAKNCLVRNVTGYLNRKGITICSAAGVPANNRIESCRAYGNAMGIVVYQPNGDEMLDSTAFLNDGNGITYYAGGGARSRMARNLSWGNRVDMQVKAGGPHLVEDCVGLGEWTSAVLSDDVRNSLIGKIRDIPGHFVGNITPAALAEVDPAGEFADPANLDFRLQATSRFRGAGPGGTDLGPFSFQGNVYFVRPGGDDKADGLSLETAWATLARAGASLRPGDTLYLDPGVYAGPFTLDAGGRAPGAPAAVRGRGTGPAVIAGVVEVLGASAVEFARLDFTGPVKLARSRDIVFENCRFGGAPGLRAEDTAGLRVVHAEFTGGALELERSTGVHSSGNIFAGAAGPALVADQLGAIRYSDYNGYRDPEQAWVVGGEEFDFTRLQAVHDRYSQIIVPALVSSDGPARAQSSVALNGGGPLGAPVGLNLPQRALREEEHAPLRLVGPIIHSVSGTTANIEWWTSAPTGVRLSWGTTAAQSALVLAHRFGQYSVTGLRPDTEYRLRIGLDAPFASPAADAAGLVEEVAVTFRTAAGPGKPAVYYVAPDGNDLADGLNRERAWRTVNQAADRVRPGDTVMLAGGVYREPVRVRVTGEPDRPVVFRAMPGEKVVFDGNNRQLNHAFLAAYKHHQRFDGFYFTGFGLGHAGAQPVPAGKEPAWNGAFALYGSDDVRVSRCFYDGRGISYAPGIIDARACAGLVLSNSVVTDAMGGGLSFYTCPDLRVEHSVFLRNKIQNIAEGVNEPNQKFYLENNIFTDSLAIKVGAPLLTIGRIESLVERNNCYYLRVPDGQRQMFSFYGTEAYRRPAESHGMALEFEEAPLITELTRMALGEYQARYAPGSGSVATDPAFAGARGQSGVNAGGEPVFLVDALMGRRDLDFPDLFATDPGVVARGIGLQPEAFADFHFQRRD